MQDSAVGELIAGRYEITGVVARGSYSVVFRALDRATGRTVAVKRLNDAVPNAAEFSERMQREHRIMNALAGTAAVRVEDLCTTRHGDWCLVMELLEGCDFEEFLAMVESRHQRLRVPELLTLLAPIVSTLEVAHRVGIVHRDLKPSNVFVCDAASGKVRLLDFALAKHPSARPLTGSNRVIGSPSYTAPEVWLGGEPLDHRGDIYSLGAIIFRALSGRVPFTGSLHDKIDQATRGPRPSLCAHRPELPRDVDLWVRQALAVAPEQRFFQVGALWNALLDSLGIEPADRGTLGASKS